jgi:hypothetical protein
VDSFSSQSPNSTSATMSACRLTATLTERVRQLGFHIRSRRARRSSAHPRCRSRGIAAEMLEPRIVLSTVTAGSVGRFFDADGDKYSVKLTGKGSVEVMLDDPDQDGRGAIAALIISGTNSKSALAITLLTAPAVTR